jgi:hypothetical protein
MAITPARERVRKSRERKRRGVIPVQVEVSTLEIDFSGIHQREWVKEKHHWTRYGMPYSTKTVMSAANITKAASSANVRGGRRYAF